MEKRRLRLRREQKYKSWWKHWLNTYQRKRWGNSYKKEDRISYNIIGTGAWRRYINNIQEQDKIFPSIAVQGVLIPGFSAYDVKKSSGDSF